MLQMNWMQSLLWNVNALFLLTQWRHRVEENRTVVFMWETTLQSHGLASHNPCCEHCNFLFGYFFCRDKTSKKTKKNVHTALSYMSVIKLQTFSVTFSFKEKTPQSQWLLSCHWQTLPISSTFRHTCHF